jgi:hypothetical protein
MKAGTNKKNKRMMTIAKVIMLSIGILAAAAILADWYLGL